MPVFKIVYEFEDEEGYFFEHITHISPPRVGDQMNLGEIADINHQHIYTVENVLRSPINPDYEYVVVTLSLYKP